MTGTVKPQTVWLDYGAAGRKRKFLPNLSCVAAAGEHLWTASDEVRTIECLKPARGGYCLHSQLALDDLFPSLPGADTGDEADIEALCVADGTLWVCGSHSLTRRSRVKTNSNRVAAKINKRRSRRLLAALPLKEDGGALGEPAQMLPIRGRGSLRTVLGATAHLKPFMALPSKENGFDIEGLAVVDKRIYVGLRGPVVENIAIIPEIVLGRGFTLSARGVHLHFIDLAGLGVRDLTRWRGGLMILAGPVSSADGPFQLYHWRPRRLDTIQKPKMIHEFPVSVDHPEGICALVRNGAEGLLVLYDTTNTKRTPKPRYKADWFKL